MTDPMETRGPRVGEVVARRFRIVGEIARGAWSTVYRAYQSDLDRFVALKIMHPDSAMDPTLVERFRREALFASQLTHPNTICTYDYGATDQGLFYIAMEVLEGRDLLTELRAHGPFELERAVSVAHQVLRSLTEVHGLGLVHRDLKPENIMLLAPRGHDTPDQPREFVKVLDFGIAMATMQLSGFTGAMSRLTRSGRVVGTPLYMSPEQLLEEHVSPASDIYALGHILFEMLVGRAAFDDPARGSMDTMMRHLDDEMPDLPAPLHEHPIQAIIRRATRKNPRERYPDARAMLDALGTLEGPLASPSRSGVRLAPAIVAQEAPPPPAVATAHLPGRRHELAWLEQQLSEVRAFGQSRIVILEGAVGIGKSRVLQTFVTGLLADRAEQPFVLHRANHSRRDIREGGLWSDVSILLGLEDAGEGSLSVHLRDALRNYSSIQESQIPILLRLLRRDPELPQSLDELKEQRRRLFDALRKPFLALSREQLFVWVIEDLQEEDPLTLAFLNDLIQAFDDASCRLLVLGTVAREEIDHSSGAARMLRPLLGAGPPWVYTLKLKGVSRADAPLVLNDVLDAPPGRDLAQSIREVTQGHPRFMIELLTQLHAAGNLQNTNGTYQMRASAPSPVVAPQLAGVIAARIDSEAQRSELGGRVVELLECVALLGDGVPRKWCRQFLEALGDKAMLTALDAALASAIASDFLHEPHEQLAFSAPLGREVVLKRIVELASGEGTLAERARLRLLSAARFLHRQWPEPTGVELRQIVRRFVAGGDVASAIRCLRHAADVAYRAFHIETALDNYLRAYRLAMDAGGLDEQEALLVLLRLGEIHGTLGDLALAEDYLARARQTASSGTSTTFKVTVLGRVLQLEGELAVQRGDWAAATQALTGARQIFQDLGDDHGIARVMTEIAHVLLLTGQPEAALDPLLEAMVLGELVGSLQVQVRAGLYLSRVRQQIGELGKAARDAQAALELCERDGNLLNRAEVLVELGQCHFLDGRISEAIVALREGVAAKLRVRDRDGVARSHKLLAASLASHGDLDEARAELQLDIALARDRQDVVSAASTGIMYADLVAELVRRQHGAGAPLARFQEAESTLSDLSRLAERRQAPALYARIQLRRVLLRLSADAPAHGFGMVHDIVTTVERLDPLALLEASMGDAWCHGLRHSTVDGLATLARLIARAHELRDADRVVLGHTLATDLALRASVMIEAQAHVHAGLSVALRNRMVFQAAALQFLKMRVYQAQTVARPDDRAFALSPAWSVLVRVHPDLGHVDA